MSYLNFKCCFTETQKYIEDVRILRLEDFRQAIEKNNNQNLKKVNYLRQNYIQFLMYFVDSDLKKVSFILQYVVVHGRKLQKR